MIRDCIGANFICRDNTRDMYVVSDVYDNNKYQVPDNLDGKLVVDIGAHIGSFSILCATRGAKVYAVEPYGASYDLLVKNIELNGLKDKIVPLKFAIGVKTQGLLYINEERPDFCSLDPDINNSDLNKAEKVKMITLRKLFRMFDGTCEILKCDAEGAEERVVDELERGLYRRVKSVCAELHYWRNEERHTGSDEKKTLDRLYPNRTDISDYEFIWTK